MQVAGHIRKRLNKDNVTKYQVVIEKPPDPDTGKRNRIYKTINGTKKQAEKVMRTMIEELENQTYVADNKLTVASWVIKWSDLFLKDLSPTTLQGYQYQIESYIVNQDIGKIRLQDLTTADVQKWVNDMHKESPISHKPMSAKTVKNIYHNLSAALDKAVNLDLVKKNVCKAVVLPKTQKYSAEIYDENEVQTLLQAIRGTDMEVPLMIDISLGLRRGELLGLKWKHIDFEKGLVSIEDNVVEVKKEIASDRVMTKSPKSLSGQRVIPISSSLISFLKSARRNYLIQKLKMGNQFYDGDYVVCQPNGKPFKPASFSSKFNGFLSKNGLKHIRLHDLRHTNATLMLMQGISPKVAQMRLGHSDYSTTMNIYSHVLKSVETEAAETIENAIFKSIAN
ncbi:MAG: site-specific integrase [Bacilli bacterium]|nr:site-specific integrase [Bacilli bacterium]